MNQTNIEKKKQLKKERKEMKRKKKNALIICRDGREYWTTQVQFWQWVRQGITIKAGDSPLTGKFIRADQEKDVVISNMVLNLACPNHLNEALHSRKFRAN